MTTTCATDRPRRRARAAIVLVLVALLAVGPTAAWGLWSHETMLQPTTASAGEVTPPTGLSCSTGGGFLGLAQHATLSWQEPASGPPDRYAIRADTGEETYTLGEVAGHTRQFEITTGLLTGLLEGLLTLILGGLRPPVTVVAVHESGWESPPTNSVSVRPGLLGLGGLRCA